MCGIAGIITPDREAAEITIRQMLPAMEHRGPDDSGHAVLATTYAGRQATVAFGFRRLAILDLSPAGHQPMVDEETGNCLVFNGEIYNYRQLRTELESLGHRFRSNSDTEVLLHALGRWGDAALDRLEGMYGLAFHRAADRSVLLARDPLGIKPLYVAELGDQLLFASEIRTLLASGVVPRDLSAEGVAGALAFGSVQAPHTVFKRIREFPAGHSQWLGRPRRRFWDFPDSSEQDQADVAEMVRERMAAAVRRHLVADVPVGIFLSAGIDSTIIAACATEACSTVSAFTIGIGERYPDDEAAVAAATARTLGMAHHVIPIPCDALSGLWHRWIESLDSPSIDGFNTWLVTKALADAGLKVGLSGLGADELFGGYPVFQTAPRLRRFASLLRLLPRPLVAGLAEAALKRAGRPGPAEKLPDILAGRGDLEAIVMGLRRIASNRSLRALKLRPPAPPPESTGQRDAFNTISHQEITNYMKNTLLRDSDANSMSHSLELRVPFLDLPLVNAVTALPGRLKETHGGPGKRLLREAMARHLPKQVLARPKTGFRLPIDEWMRGGMRGYCEAAIDACKDISVLDPVAVHQVWRDFADATGPRSWALPFALVALGSFARRHACVRA